MAGAVGRAAGEGKLTEAIVDDAVAGAGAAFVGSVSIGAVEEEFESKSWTEKVGGGI